MSKAKELATNILMEVGVMTGEDFKLCVLALCKVVLSEPDEQEKLKGWIEVTNKARDEKDLINLRHVYSLEIYEDCCRIWFDNRNDKTLFKESYDEIKRKIMEAS